MSILVKRSQPNRGLFVWEDGHNKQYTIEKEFVGLPTNKSQQEWLNLNEIFVRDGGTFHDDRRREDDA